jgi:hypothetical protein
MVKRRRRYKQTASFKERLSAWAADVRARAAQTKPGPERDVILKRASQADMAAYLDDLVHSTEPRSSK